MKRLFLLAATFIVALGANAQVTFDEDEQETEGIGIGVQDRRTSVVSVGMKAGVNYTTMGKYKEVDLGVKGGVGFQAGAVVTARFGKYTKGSDAGTGRFAAQIEPSFVQHTIGTDYEDIKLSYFEVPILAKYYFFPTAHVEAGVCVAGTLSASPDNIRVDLNEPWPGRESVTIATGDIKGFDVRPFIGAGYSFSKGVGVNARYYLGTSELAENFPCKINTLEVSLALTFDVLKF